AAPPAGDPLDALRRLALTGRRDAAVPVRRAFRLLGVDAGAAAAILAGLQDLGLLEGWESGRGGGPCVVLPPPAARPLGPGRGPPRPPPPRAAVGPAAPGRRPGPAPQRPGGQRHRPGRRPPRRRRRRRRPARRAGRPEGRRPGRGRGGGRPPRPAAG